MDAQELHDACYDAMCQCPQFRGWDDDGEFSGYGQFGKIPSKGLYKTIQFWREWGDLLWERGYEKVLPQEAQDLFDNIERVIEQAIKDYCKGLRKTTPPAAPVQEFVCSTGLCHYKAQRQPLTEEYLISHFKFKPRVDTGSLMSFINAVRFAEAAHGITGEQA
jgi:hypothetical protein